MSTFASQILQATDNSDVPLPESASECSEELHELKLSHHSPWKYALEHFVLGGHRYVFEVLSRRLPASIYAAEDGSSYMVHEQRTGQWVRHDTLVSLSAHVSSEIVNRFSQELRELVANLRPLLDGEYAPIFAEDAKVVIDDALECVGSFSSGEAPDHLSDWNKLFKILVARERQEETTPAIPGSFSLKHGRPKSQTFEDLPKNEFSVGDVRNSCNVKHWCDQCKKSVWLNRIKLSRAAVPRCIDCGTVLVLDEQSVTTTDKILFNSSVRRVKKH